MHVLHIRQEYKKAINTHSSNDVSLHLCLYLAESTVDGQAGNVVAGD